jgi:hypothetical protein
MVGGVCLRTHARTDSLAGGLSLYASLLHTLARADEHTAFIKYMTQSAHAPAALGAPPPAAAPARALTGDAHERVLRT